ncbi:ABC transporter substrate-binding protein [Desulfotomaculum nigrificans]|uniref:ABC transporter substrate-binding protein n=1 Tax=Desulfotomaculum nigrificans TaxID=1565 RepID=UPI0001FAE81E|nr:ABC transporter substrate-binding protein [Desulfotomaculum nigrificans]
MKLYSKVKQKLIALCMLAVLATTLVTGCGTSADSGATKQTAANLSLDEITKKAKEEGKIVSVGMPDSWANWKDTWNDLSKIYGLQHTDTDMSSAEEIAKFEAEKDKPTADIGDIGLTFAPVAVTKGVTQPYKTSYWNDIPAWAKDKDGHWIVGYQGTIAFIVNKKIVKDPPKSWADLLKGNYKVAVGDVSKAAQAQNAILATALALGGNESNIEPALDFYAQLAKQKRLSTLDPSIANLEKGEVEVGILWDFNALGYRDRLGKENYEVCIPSDGSVVSGYATIINKYAPHPHAAMLAREYILSDQGQINLAKGYARPIRDNVTLPDDVKAILLPKEEYKNAKPIQDFKAWETTAKKLPQLWQEKVLINMQ